MRARRLRAAAAVLLALAPAAVAAQEPQPVDVLLRVVQQNGDRTPPRVFRSIAAHRSDEALEALQRAAPLVSSPTNMRACYESFARFRRHDTLEERALAALLDAATSGPAPRRVAAAHGLARFGSVAHAELRELVETSPVDGVRHVAIGPLLPALRLGRTSEDLELILDHYRYPESGDRERAVRTLAAFRSPEHLRRMGERLRRGALDPGIRGIVLEALARARGEDADEALAEALDADDPVLLLAAIEAAAERGADRFEHRLDDLAREGLPVVRAAAMLALSEVVPDDVRWRRRVLLASRHDDRVLRAAAATILGRSRFDDAHERLVEMLDDETWSVRTAVYDALVESRRADAVPPLLDRLEAESRLRRERVREALALLTGEDHGAAAARWRAWWRDVGEGFEPPPLAVARARHAERVARRSDRVSFAAFYGIPVVADRVAFVVDTSGSMAAGVGTGGDDRLDVAKEQLLGVIDRLPGTASFNLVFFDDRVDFWRAGLADATDASRRAARRFVERAVADGGTALYDGIVAAWEDDDVEAIYVLSDGAPSAGRIVEPAAILAEIRTRARLHPGTRVHCVSVGTGSGLLESIAEATGGTYRVVR